MSESIDHSWICREDFGIERNQSFKGDQGNAQFSLCCTSTALCCKLNQEAGLTPVWRQAYTLFLNPGNMSGGKLPMTVALDHCVRELHDSIEWFAVRCSFHARFPENNCRVIAVKPR